MKFTFMYHFLQNTSYLCKVIIFTKVYCLYQGSAAFLSRGANILRKNCSQATKSLPPTEFIQIIVGIYKKTILKQKYIIIMHY